MNASSAGLRIEDLEFGYAGGPFRLRVPSLAVAPGEKVAVIGPSGSGKSTLLHLASGIFVPSSGKVELDGVDLARASDAARRANRISNIGLVFQEFELLDHLSVLENVELPYDLNPALKRSPAVRERARSLLDSAGMIEHAAKRPRALSQGERQRVAICRALVAEPRWLFADEPTGNLDPDTTARVMDLLFAEVDRRGATLLFVTHDHGLLGRFDRAIDLADLAAGGA